MMTPEETRARAERAAEWLADKLELPEPPKKYISGVWSFGLKSDKEMIAFCEDRGWRDPIPTEQEAVVWLMKNHRYSFYWNTGTGWRHAEFCNHVNPVEEATRLGYAEGEG